MAERCEDDVPPPIWELPGLERAASQSLRHTLHRRLGASQRTNSLAKSLLLGAQVDVCGTTYHTEIADEVPEEPEGSSEYVPDHLTSIASLAAKTSEEKGKLVIILVGLPGRGKTYLCNKLMCYLNWLGHVSRHFNVGAFRRKMKTEDEGGEQDAHFFDHTNEEGMRQRQQALDAALDALRHWLSTGKDHQVAIFDATNSTEERRQYLIKNFHGRFKYMFIESICDDQATLTRNIELKLKYSPDYADMDHEKAMEDFRARIAEYEKVYEPLTGRDGTNNRNLHFIKLVNMVTGKGYIDINRISGYIPGKIVFFLMQVCRSGLDINRRIWLTRHGESQYNRNGLIGGDSVLTDKGRMYSHALARALCTLVPIQEQTQDSSDPLISVSCWTSTLARTIQTARHIPFPKLRWKALDEIQAGICDGYTYEEIKKKWPETYQARKEDKLNFRYPAGESYMDVVKRLEPLITEVERESSSVCVVGHQAILRVLYGYFMQVDLREIPELKMPLHTLIELEPRPDGTMFERRYKINIDSVGDDDVRSHKSTLLDTVLLDTVRPRVQSPLRFVYQVPVPGKRIVYGESSYVSISTTNEGDLFMQLFESITEQMITTSPGSKSHATSSASPPPSTSSALQAAVGAARETAEAAGKMSRSTSKQNLHAMSSMATQGMHNGHIDLEKLTARLENMGGMMPEPMPMANGNEPCMTDWPARPSLPASGSNRLAQNGHR